VNRRFPGRRWRPARPSPGNIRAACCIGDNSVGEFYSVALTNNYQQADTGTKMIHIGKNTTSTIVSKGISAGHGQNTYRGLVKILKRRDRRAQLHAVRFAADGRQVRRAHLPVHRSEEHLGAGGARGDDLEDRRGPDFLLPAARHLEEDAVGMIVNGFCKEVFRELPMEFAVEAQKLLGVSLEGSVGVRSNTRWKFPASAICIS
jgi:Fe-S cluster assembly protein SufB